MKREAAEGDAAKGRAAGADGDRRAPRGKERGRDVVSHVASSAAGQTVATFLRDAHGGVAWSVVRGWIRGRRVMIDGNICVDEARRLKGGEVVKLLARPAPAPPDPNELRIVHLDDHVVVVEKPSGVTTVRHHEERGWPARRRQLQPTLDEMLPAAIARRLRDSRPRRGTRNDQRASRGKAAHGTSRASPTARPGPVLAVHRIDRETSGLVVFARTVPAARILAEQFRLHTTHRRYLAIVQGRAKTATIRSHLVRDRGDGRRGSAEASGRDRPRGPRRPVGGHDDAQKQDEHGDGKLAVTHVRVLERYGRGHTLLECSLETGRTHQIRIHLSEAGHPLCGERVYAGRGRTPPDASGASRVALHAAELGFVHPVTGEEVRFTSPLPADMREIVARLRRSSDESRSAGTETGKPDHGNAG